jgi:hypothetical protein
VAEELLPACQVVEVEVVVVVEVEVVVVVEVVEEVVAAGQTLPGPHAH